MAERLDILFVTGEYPPSIGGVGDYTRQLGRALIAAVHWVTVLGRTSSDVEHAAGDPTLLSVGSMWGWQALRRTARTSRDLAPAVIHIQYQTGAYNMHPAINLLPGRLRGLPRRPRIVVTAHDLRLPYLFPKADLLRSWVTTRLFNDADALIVTNAEDEQRVRGHHTADRTLYSPPQAVKVPVHCIPIGSNIAPHLPANYDRATWRAQQHVGPEDVLIGYFGLLNRTKGVAELVEALALLPQHFKLVIIGGAAVSPEDQRYAAEVQTLIARRQIQERVHITGPCSEAEVSAHLLAADMLALPFHDGASYRRGSLLAALSHGIPTITTTPATLLDPPLIDGVHAMCLPSAKVGLLNDAIKILADDATLRARLASGGRNLAMHFDWPNIAAQHELVYHTLLEAHNSGLDNGTRHKSEA